MKQDQREKTTLQTPRPPREAQPTSPRQKVPDRPHPPGWATIRRKIRPSLLCRIFLRSSFCWCFISAVGVVFVVTSPLVALVVAGRNMELVVVCTCTTSAQIPSHKQQSIDNLSPMLNAPRPTSTAPDPNADYPSRVVVPSDKRLEKGQFVSSRKYPTIQHYTCYYSFHLILQ